jgi:hypothetical protein
MIKKDTVPEDPLKVGDSDYYTYFTENSSAQLRVPAM